MKITDKDKQKPCTIQNVMCCTYKWMMAAGILSLITLMVAVIINWCITFNDELGRWADVWLMVTLLELIASGLAAIATHWRDVKDFMCDVLRCA